MNRKKWLILVCMTALLGMTACSSGNNGSNPSSTPGNAQQPSETSHVSDEDKPFGKYEETVTVTLGRQGVSGNNLPAGDTLEDNEYVRYVEERLNVDIKYDFSVEDLDAYNQKVTLAIASNNIPDVMIVNEQQFHRLAQANMLADLTDI